MLLHFFEVTINTAIRIYIIYKKGMKYLIKALIESDMLIFGTIIVIIKLIVGMIRKLQTGVRWLLVFFIDKTKD